MVKSFYYDSAVFPLSITANTAAATMMIADKGTDIIVKSLQAS
jgi:choline dehydrogenase